MHAQRVASTQLALDGWFSALRWENTSVLSGNTLRNELTVAEQCHANVASHPCPSRKPGMKREFSAMSNEWMHGERGYEFYPPER